MIEHTQTEFEARAVPIASASARNIAMNTGALSTAIRRQFERILREQNGNQQEATKMGVDELFERGLINTQEVQDLKLVCGLVFQVIDGKEDPSKAAKTVGEVYNKMVLDPHGSPAALGIAGAVNSMFDDTAGQESAALDVTFFPENAATGAVVGAAAGALAGAAFGGGVGAAIGAAVGAAVGAVFGACNGNEGGPDEPDLALPSNAATQH